MKFEQYLKKVENKKQLVIDEIEKQCYGSSESVLPAIFFAKIEELTPKQVITLDCYVDMYRIGRGVRD